MWCTRWYLPLLLLPLPTAPPYFLVLFLLSLTLHAKPCFYCIVLLTTLFVSSCYWQPFPLDTPLSTPWAENITTFAEALNSTLSANYTGPLPTVIRAVDRCWCDLSFGGFFYPFNVSDWERVSVLRLKTELEGQQRTQFTTQVLDTLNGTSSAIAPAEHNNTGEPPFLFRARKLDLSSIGRLLRRSAFRAHGGEEQTSEATSADLDSTPETNQPRESARELDLRPYGLDIVIDYDWTSV